MWFALISNITCDWEINEINFFTLTAELKYYNKFGFVLLSSSFSTSVWFISEKGKTWKISRKTSNLSKLWEIQTNRDFKNSYQSSNLFFKIQKYE